MSDFSVRFPIALAMMTAGAAGFASMWAGSLVTTSLVRAVVSGLAGWFVGKVIAIAWSEGPLKKVRYSGQTDNKEEKEKA